MVYRPLLSSSASRCAAGVVRWVQGEEYGVETLVIDDESREDLDEYLNAR